MGFRCGHAVFILVNRLLFTGCEITLFFFFSPGSVVARVRLTFLDEESLSNTELQSRVLADIQTETADGFLGDLRVQTDSLYVASARGESVGCIGGTPTAKQQTNSLPWFIILFHHKRIPC